MIDPKVLRNQSLVSKRLAMGKRPNGSGGYRRVMCECGLCLRCRKREWMRAARRRLHKDYWKH